MNLKAKPIIKDQYWVVTDGEKKVGNVVAEGSGYQVKIGNTKEHYESMSAIAKKKKIEFEKLSKRSKQIEPPFAVFPTSSSRVYNSIFDVKKKLHIYTKTPKSKCYYAAGWFVLKQGDEYQTIFCPKYIFIQRYDYKGPFKSETEAKSSINT